MQTTALVAIDMQREFFDQTKPFEIGSWKKAFSVPGVELLLGIAKERGWKIVHVDTEHESEKTLPAHLRRRNVSPYCLPQSPGVQPVTTRIDSDVVIKKTHFNAFLNTNLEDVLAGISNVVYCGIAIDCCVLQTAFWSDKLGFRGFVPIQGVSASTREAYVGGLISVYKSAADVFDLNQLENGHSLVEASCNHETTEELAKCWYDRNMERIKEAPHGLMLDDLVHLLTK